VGPGITLLLTLGTQTKMMPAKQVKWDGICVATEVHYRFPGALTLTFSVTASYPLHATVVEVCPQLQFTPSYIDITTSSPSS
jgi:hypothetical protein